MLVNNKKASDSEAFIKLNSLENPTAKCSLKVILHG